MSDVRWGRAVGNDQDEGAETASGAQASLPPGDLLLLDWPPAPFEVELNDFTPKPCWTCPQCGDPECDALCGGDL